MYRFTEQQARLVLLLTPEIRARVFRENHIEADSLHPAVIVKGVKKLCISTVKPWPAEGLNRLIVYVDINNLEGALQFTP
jgi:hypothetical protein